MRYIALLRGINVGGHRIIKMADLRTMVVAAGARDVETYIQSGNVVFSHAHASAAELEKQIAKATGFDVAVILRTADEWNALIAQNPFTDAANIHVFFTAAPVTCSVVASKPERYEVWDRDVYVDLPNGLGRSKLAGSLAKALPGATARNWRTVLQLKEMASK
jgi:uncharacterized protein (DUF1697 family)